MGDDDEFITQLGRVRGLVDARLADVLRGAGVCGTEPELRMILRDLERAEIEARAGSFAMSKSHRTLASAHHVLSSWPLDDWLAVALVELEAEYRRL
jgi:hypothetical protein